MKIIHKEKEVLVEAIHGAFRTYASPLDAVIGECKVQLGISYRGGLSLTHRLDLRMDSAQLSRVRSGEKMPNHWLLRFHVWSGLPLSLIEELANMESDIQPHEKVR